MQVNHRSFMRAGLASFTASFRAPARMQKPAPAPTVGTDRHLVVIYLDGGADGLSMVIPYTDPYYRSRRPTLSIPASEVLQVGADASGKRLGLHPRLVGLKRIYDAGGLAILQRVGYPNATRSHIHGLEVWSTADLTGDARFGWLGRYLDGLGQLDPLYAVNSESMLPRALQVSTYQAPSIPNLGSYCYRSANGGSEGALERSFAEAISAHIPADRPHLAVVQRSMADALATVDRVQTIGTYTPSITYPNSGFGRTLQMVAGSIMKNVGSRLYFVRMGGFDTHAQQQTRQGCFFNLMATLDDGLAAFYQDMANQGKIGETLVLAFSEFGRRIDENASGGTDHGAAGCMLVMGGTVRGGLYGTAPDLNPAPENLTLESNGRDVRFETDFRAVYATVAEQWLGADATALLSGAFRDPALTFLA
jgi:uncharacterized protein (DUF1501 family)